MVPVSELKSDVRSEDVDMELAYRIAKRCVELAPELTGGQGIDKLDIVRHGVGLRPSRCGGARLEMEVLDYGIVVHNYGQKKFYRQI